MICCSCKIIFGILLSIIRGYLNFIHISSLIREVCINKLMKLLLKPLTTLYVILFICNSYVFSIQSDPLFEFRTYYLYLSCHLHALVITYLNFKRQDFVIGNGTQPSKYYLNLQDYSRSTNE